MKNIILTANVWLLGFVTLAGICFYGCNDAANDAITGNCAYIKDAYEKKAISVYLDLANTGRLNAPISISRRDDTRDITITVSAAGKALEDYNRQYGKNYKMYPTAFWSFESDRIIIPKGKTSTVANIIVQPMSAGLIASGDTYAIPVAISNASDVGVLKGAETMFYILKRLPNDITVLDMPTTGGSTTATAAHLLDASRADSTIKSTALTIEFLMKVLSRSNAHNFKIIGALNNVDGQIFSRIEGGGSGNNWEQAGIEWNIEPGQAISAVPPGGVIELNKWYHVAFTFGNGKIQIYINGQMMKSMDVTRKVIEWYGGLDWHGASFNTYYSPMSRNHIQCAELRVWEVVRTQAEINDNMYYINPNTPGLWGYWKMDDSAGDVLKDYSPNGRHGQRKDFIRNSNSFVTAPGKNFDWLEHQNITINQ